MNANQLISIFDLFGWTNVHSSTITSGLINHTWKIDADQGEFILQRINTNIFASPEKIDANIGMIAAYLEKKSPDYLFTIPVTTIDGNRLVEAPNQVFRAFNYIPNTNTISVVETADQAKEAAQTFSSFTKALIDFPIDQLHITLENQKNLVNQFNQYIANKAAYKRVMHHDTKISNILFDERGKGLCVIDLDTVMPGFLFSDVGDMFRTYISPVSEEEQNLDKIEVRKDFVEAIYEGYTSELKDAITQFELDHFYLSGEILIYMQSLRFITDYLQNDVYYGKKYPDHNLVRALNQYRLLELFQASTH
jgi:thiamine kinase-like enzyme